MRRHAAILSFCLLAGCSGGPGGSAGPAVGAGEGAAHPMVGRLAPPFTAQDPSGLWLPFENFKDKPLALLFLRPGTPFAAELAGELGRLRNSRVFGPVVFLGLGRGSVDGIKQFIARHRIPLPILRDPGAIARAYGIGDLPTVVLVDTDGVVRFRLDGFAGPRFRARLEATAAALRTLPEAAKAAGRGHLDLAWTSEPLAPVFAARPLEGAPFDLARQRGKVVAVLFFDQDCPHCERDLPPLTAVLREFRPRGVVAVGIATSERGRTLREFLKRHRVDFPVIADESRSIFRQYDSTRTPDLFLIDRDGMVRFREQGDRPDRGDLTRLQIRLMLGEDPKSLAATLPAGRVLGDGTCRACHLREYRDWLLTPHSIAWDSLQAGEKWRDPECVRCHVTGQGRPGGFAAPDTTLHLVNVQCEVCHGDGGGHAGGAPLDLEAMGKTCDGCHTGKFVLNFDRDEALALVSHRDHPDMAKLFRYSDAQRQRLDAINTRRLEKFKSGVGYVGAAACRDCHRAQHDHWSRTAHAGAYARLQVEDRGADAECTPCHTTGAGKRGGFGDREAPGGPMTHVQCEVCHGPGEDHVKAPPALKKQTIYGITDQCSFCIVQGVCVTCHDQKNDPDFDLEAALPKVTH